MSKAWQSYCAFTSVDMADVPSVKLKEMGIDDAVALIQKITHGKLEKVCSMVYYNSFEVVVCDA